MACFDRGVRFALLFRFPVLCDPVPLPGFLFFLPLPNYVALCFPAWGDLCFAFFTF